MIKFFSFIAVGFLSSPFVFAQTSPTVEGDPIVDRTESVEELAVPRQIAFTFDDGPSKDTVMYKSLARIGAIIQSLQEADVPQAAFFVNGKNHREGISNLALDWIADAGHVIGNHTFSHPHMSETLLKTYLEDVEQGHTYVSALNGARPLFRYPFLQEGETEAYRMAVKEKLSELGYRNAYVTIDNYDWYMNHLVVSHLAQGGKVDFKKLEKLYVDILLECIEFYDALAVDVLGYSPKHVMLLHENDLAAKFLPALLKRLKDDGWEFVGIEEAYEDPLSEQDPVVLGLTQGRIGQIAKAEGFLGELSHSTESRDELAHIFEQEGVLIPRPD